LAARARLTWAGALACFEALECLLCLADAVDFRVECFPWARLEDGFDFRDVGRADRRGFFLFKSFSL
jgi:hypothetical protein